MATIQQPDIDNSRRDRWIPWTFVGFFVLVFAANGIMITFAFTSWTGLTSDDTYRHGLAYNEVLEQSDAQARLGWDVAILDGATPEVQLRERNGQPLTGAAVDLRLSRPGRPDLDMAITLTDRGDGRHVGETALPVPGQWEALITVRRGDAVHHSRQRLTAAP